MFNINDKVVYPGHGVAKITRIIEKLVAAQVCKFYELKFLNKEMTILMPTNNAQTIGLRALSSSRGVRDILKLLAQPVRPVSMTDVAGSWNKRHKEYQVKLRSGSLEDIAEIYRDLQIMSHFKELSFGEKSLLSQTEVLLVEEISLVNQLAEEKTIEDLRSLFSSFEHHKVLTEKTV